MKTVKVKPIAISIYFLFKNPKKQNNKKRKRNKSVVDASEHYNLNNILILCKKYGNY